MSGTNKNAFKKPIMVVKPLRPNKEAVFAAFSEVFDSGWFTNMGSQHFLLEKRIGEYLNCPHVSIFNNGTIALITALKALALPLGSEVITTPFTFAATPHSIAWNGLKPVFADIDPQTMTLSIAAIERAITARTSAIMGVHVYGFPCDVVGIEKLARQRGLRVIYDGAHAFSTEIDGTSICDWGDISMLSFHSTKLFNTIEGGALVYKDKELVRTIYELRNFGIKRIENKEEIKEGIKSGTLIDEVGINGKMNEFQAAWGLEVLKEVGAEQERRGRVAAVYRENLASLDWISIPEMPKNTSNSMQYFPIFVENGEREMLYTKLLAHNVYSRKYFYPLCSDFHCYKNVPSATPNNLPVAHAIADKVLCLPFYGELAENDCAVVRQLCEIIRG